MNAPSEWAAVLGPAFLELREPASLAFLILALFALWFVRRGETPALRSTGAIEIWRMLAGGQARATGRARRRVPPSGWWLVAALAAGSLALAGVRWTNDSAGATWSVLVDRSPSMYLPYVESRSAGNDHRQMRMERALGSLSQWLQDGGGAPRDVHWVSSGPGGLETRTGTAPPADWLRPAPRPLPAPDWTRFDRPGWIWITDLVPEEDPRAAGVFASGGLAVPGFVGAMPGVFFLWNGETVTEERHGGRAPTAWIDDDAPEPIRRVISAWSEVRGIALVSSPELPADLERDGAANVLRVTVSTGAAGSGATVRVRAGRDQWSAGGRAIDAGAARFDEHLGVLEPWLVARLDGAGSELTLVGAVPGRIDLAWHTLDEPAGDPAAFAVSWGKLCDRSCLPLPGVVELSERMAAGTGNGGDARRRDAAQVAGRSVTLEPWLASLAAGFALAYVVARSKGR